MCRVRGVVSARSTVRLAQRRDRHLRTSGDAHGDLAIDPWQSPLARDLEHLVRLDFVHASASVRIPSIASGGSPGRAHSATVRASGLHGSDDMRKTLALMGAALLLSFSTPA